MLKKILLQSYNQINNEVLTLIALNISDRNNICILN